jgi:hypothetical protein
MVLVALALGVEASLRAENLSFSSSGGPGLRFSTTERSFEKDDNGSTGIVKFAFRTRSGDHVSLGKYTVEVYGTEATDEEGVAARKFFVEEG